MENTGKVLFDDQAPEWYLAVGTSWLGPLTAADVYSKVANGEVSLAHFVWRKGQKGWQRICDTDPFRAAGPHQPSKALIAQVSERSKPSSRARPPGPPKAEEDVDRKIWFLYFNETQFGPFSASEVEKYIQAGKVHSRVHAWREGMEGWQRLEKVSFFHAALKSVPTVQPARARGTREKPSDKRGTPRKPMLAKIYLSNDKELVTAVCRDISVGGMQVLTDRIPGEVGGKIKLNVSPTEKSGFKAFVAEGTIVRLLEDGRGFSFRFVRLSELARKSIETYIQNRD